MARADVLECAPSAEERASLKRAIRVCDLNNHAVKQAFEIPTFSYGENGRKISLSPEIGSWMGLVCIVPQKAAPVKTGANLASLDQTGTGIFHTATPS